MTATDDVKVPLTVDVEAGVGATKTTPAIEHTRGFYPSDLVFLQASPLVTKGFRQGQLEHDDLLPIRDGDQSEILASKMREAWNEQLRAGKTPTMWRALITVFGRHYLTIAVLAFGSGACKISSAIFLGQFISFLQTPDAPLARGIGFGAGLALAMLMFSILESHFMMHAYRIGIRARVAVTAFLYSHLLTLSGATLPPVGQTLNVISNDAQRLEDAAPFLIFTVLGPLETCIVIGITWIYMGWAAAAAFGTLIVMLLLVSTNMGRFKVARGNMVDARDRRIRLLSELIKSIEMIKLYAWESAFVRLVLDARHEEVAHLQKWYNLKGINTVFTWAVPGAMAVAGFFSWFFGIGTTFTTKGVFTSLLLFGAVRVNMSWRVPRSIELVADLRISFQRIEEFLNLKATAAVTPLNQTDEETNTVLAFNSATFAWTPNQPILRDVDLTIRAGQIVAVIGQVGSGKSSLLLAALGQLHTNRTDAVRRVTDVAYTPQAAYVFPGTVEDNIVMASPVDADRLARVVAVCQLTPDIARWDNGLQTRLGERGVKVSGGQRARLCLARALYHADATQARLVVLDDVFAALDAHVAATIFIELRDFFKASDAAVVIVTHHLHLVAQCDEVVYLHSGSVLAHGPLAQVVAVAAERDPYFAAVVAEFTGVGAEGAGDEKVGSDEQEDIGPNGQTAGPSRGVADDEEEDGGLIGGMEGEDWDEHAQQGFDAGMFWRFLKLSNGAALMIGALIMGFGTFTMQALADYQLSAWAAAPSEHQSESRYWVPYVALTAGVPLAALLFTYGFYRVMLHSSARLFEQMLHNVVKATPYFFQINPAGRILNRMGKDMALADETLPDAFAEVVRLWIYIVMIVIIVAIAVPWILLALAPVIFAFFLLRRRYVAANRP
ncbi:Multidrug resistance-associated protein 4, partial [Allomyces arbusculus]